MNARSNEIGLSALTLDALDRACEQAFLAHAVEKERIQRLIRTAFENPLKAEHGLKACLKGFGLDGTLKVLNNEGLLHRSHYFGFMRGSILARGDKFRANQALQELPEAIREHEILGKKLGDLINVRRTMLEQTAERQRGDPEPDRDGKTRGRERMR